MADAQAAVLTQNRTPAEAEQELRSLSKPEQRRVLVELIQQGRNDEEIGGLFGLSQWQVRNLRYRLGIKKDRGGNVHIDHSAGAAPDAGTGAVLQPFAMVEASGSLFAVTMAGMMTADQLAHRFEGLRAMFGSADPGKRFEVRIQVTETHEDR